MKSRPKEGSQGFPQSQSADRPSQKLERRGGVIMMGKLCTSTASGIRADYKELKLEIRKAGQWVSRKRQTQPQEDLLPEMKRDFSDSILVGNERRPGYAYEDELRRIIENPSQTPSDLAITMIANRVGLTESTVRTYTKCRSNRPVKKS